MRRYWGFAYTTDDVNGDGVGGIRGLALMTDYWDVGVEWAADPNIYEERHVLDMVSHQVWHDGAWRDAAEFSHHERVDVI